MNPIVQVTLAVCAVFVLYMIARYIVSQDTLVVSDAVPDRDQNVMLMPERGSDVVIGTSKNTRSSNASSVLNLQPSVNRSRGDEFSLSFNLQISDPRMVCRRCLLLWGDKRYVKFRNESNKDITLDHLMVFMPLIWIEKSGPNDDFCICVYYNTSNTLVNKCCGNIGGRPDVNSGNSIINVKEPFVVTVVFKDAVTNGMSVGVSCSLFVNKNKVAETVTPGESFKRNSGLMYVMPSDMRQGLSKEVSVHDVSPSNFTVSKLSYHNYALSQKGIEMKMCDCLRGMGCKKMSFDVDVQGGRVNSEKSMRYNPIQDLASHYTGSGYVW